MSVTFSKSKGLYKDGIRIQCFFKHDVFTSALSVCRHDNGFITLDYHDDNGVHFIEVTDKDVDFLMSCDDSQTAFDYALSLIPPSENTDNKTVATGEQVGVVDSVGDALFNEHELTVINMLVNHRITLLKVSQKTDLYPLIYKVLLSVEKKTRFNNEQISYEQSLFNKECEL